MLVLLSMVLISTTCEREEFTDLTVINNSIDTLLWYMKSDTLLWDNNIYPVEGAKENHMINPYSSTIIREEFTKMNDTNYPHLFLFDKIIIDTTSWDIIKADYIVLRRYDLSLQDLENSNWTITYP